MSDRTFNPRDYEEYLEKHIGNVQKAYAFLLDAGIVDKDERTKTIIENHDQSKYSDEEFNPYGERFYGKYKDSEEDDLEFKKAWLHHQHNNPHHWQHWCLLEDDNAGKVECIDMPEEYLVEMLCDWLSFSIDKNDLSGIQEWYKGHKKKQKLSDKTRERVEDLLKQIDEKKSLWVNRPTAGLYGNTWKSVKPVAANGDMIAYYQEHPEELKKKKEEDKIPLNAATSEDKRRMIEQRLRGTTQNMLNARSSEFDPAVYEMLRQNPRLMGYIEPWMDTAQAVVIQDAIDAGVDVSKLQDPKYNFMQMQAILDYLKEGIDVTKYTKDGRNALIIRQIGEAIKQGMTESQIRQMLFMPNWMQMQQIRLGHKAGIDVSSYATKPGMDWQKMQEIRKRLAEEKRKPSAALKRSVQAMAHKIIDIPPYGKVVDITTKGDAEQEAIAEKIGIEKLRAASTYIKTKIPQKFNSADSFEIEVNKEFVKKLRDPRIKRPTQVAHASMELNGLIEASELIDISKGKSHTSRGNEFAQEFAYFKTYFQLWGQVYSAILNIGIIYESGVEKLKLYAITNVMRT